MDPKAAEEETYLEYLRAYSGLECGALNCTQRTAARALGISDAKNAMAPRSWFAVSSAISQMMFKPSTETNSI